MMESTRVELAADMAVVSKDLFARVPGPPYPVTFRVIHGERWPEIQLSIHVGEGSGVDILTTEPRLKSVLRELLEDL